MRPIQPPPQASDISLVGDSDPAVRPATHPTESNEVVKTERRQEERRPTRAQSTHREHEGKRSSSDSSGARALYENGDLDAALAAAQKAGATELASKIATFRKELAAARADLSFKDGAGAIKHFTTALAIDEQISNGWSKLGGEIRTNLSKLYQMAGMREIEKGDNAKAQSLLERALKYDPSNEKAKSFLEKVKSKPSAPACDAASAADRAFGD
jgi:tetratricopeptide (TPR) repeat protein